MKKIVRLSVIALIALAAIAVVGCDFLNDVATYMAAPTVTVKDARTGTGVASAIVTLTPIVVQEGESMNPITATTSASGVAIFTEAPYGSYTVSASKSGYVFIPFQATIAGWNENLGDMFGAETTKEGDDSAVSIFLTWQADGDEGDMDAYFTYPNRFEESAPLPLSVWNEENATDNYYDYDLGSRDKVNFVTANKNDINTDFASLDIDDLDGPGPETITLIGNNTGGVSGSPITVDPETPFLGGVLAAGTYYWLGAGDYYLDSYDSTNLADKSIQVAITQGSSIMGLYTLPTNTTLDTIRLFRVHLFYEGANPLNWHLVFMPVFRLVDGTSSIRALSDIPTDSVLVVSGSK